MLVLSPIKIDLRKQTLREAVYAVQNDSNTRGLELTLVEGESPWNIPVDTTAAISFRKPDGTSGLYDTLPDGVTKAAEITQNKVTAIFAPQVLTCPGRVDVSLILFDSLMNRLGTFPIPVFVSEDPSAGQGISNDYYNFQTLGELNEALATKAPMEYTKKVGNPHNLLDNSDFRNPVNQRGQTIYDKTSGYTIDRWFHAVTFSINIWGDGITIYDPTDLYGAPFCQQVLWSKKDVPLTLAVCDSYGVISIVSGTTVNTEWISNKTAWGTVGIKRIDDNYIFVNIKVDYGYMPTFRWAALYEGKYTAETLPEYQPNGYENELLVCKQYDNATGVYIGLTPAFVGAAPSGYGLGENCIPISDCHVTKNGFYMWDVGCANSPFEFATLLNLSRYGAVGSKLALCSGGPYQGCIAHKVGEQEWEYLNPPMVEDTEYRTTERCDGLPVYAKRISYTPSEAKGSQTKATVWSVPHGISNFGKLVRVNGTLDDAYPFPVYGADGSVLAIYHVDASYLNVISLKYVTTSKETFDIYYTKST